MANVFTQNEFDDTQYEDNLSTIGDDVKNLMKCVGEVSKDVAALKEETQELKQILSRIEAKFSSGIPAPGNDSSSENVSNAAKPFVTIIDDLEEKHDLCLPKHTLNQLIGSNVEREAVRILLLHFYDVKALKGFTLSGTSRSNSSNSTAAGSSTSEIQMFPPHFVMLIQAAVLRLFPPSQKVKESCPKTYEGLLVTQKKDCKAHITALRQYFRDSYDDEGKRKRAPPTPENASKNKKASKRRNTSDKEHSSAGLEN